MEPTTIDNQEPIAQLQTDIEKIKTALRELANSTKASVTQQIALSSTATADLIDTRVRGLSADIEGLEKDIDRLKLRQEKLEDNDSKQTTAIEELLGADRTIHVQIEKSTRQLDEIQSRLDGTRIAQIKESSLEAMRVVVNQNAEQLAGAGGQLPYREIQVKLQNTLFLGQVLKLLASLFGVGGLLAAGSALLGVGKSPDLAPIIAEQRTKIEVLSADSKKLSESIDKLEARINRFSDRQPTTASR